MNPYQKFIILSAPRSGSTYLNSLLSDHPNVVSMGEIFNENKIWGWPDKEYLQKLSFLMPFRDRFPDLFLKLFIFHQYNPAVAAVGFKLLYYHTENHTLRDKLMSYLAHIKDLKIIHLTRKNTLEVLVSLRLAEATSVWTSYDGKSDNKKTHLSYDECLIFFSYIDHRRKKLNRIFKNHDVLNLSYDDLAGKPDHEISRVQNFLGVKILKLLPKIQKLNHRPMKDVVANYETLKRQFGKTEWSQFFYE